MLDKIISLDEFVQVQNKITQNPSKYENIRPSWGRGEIAPCDDPKGACAMISAFVEPV